MVRFNKFTVKILNPNYSTVASALYPMVMEALKEHHRMATKELLALYLCGTSISNLNRDSVKFTFVQQPQRSLIQINDVFWRVHPGEESLYRILFKYMSEDTYTLSYYNINSLNQRILHFRTLFNKYFEINTVFGCDAIRQLRLYALINDYQVSKQALVSIYGYKTWVFGGKLPLLDREIAKTEILKGIGVKIT